MNTPKPSHSKAPALSGSRQSSFANQLLNWYDQNARNLSWRVPPEESKAGVLPKPYQVWLSEVMLQQTQVATVREYYLKFLTFWPDIGALAAADTEDVMKAWAGLGYYSRARNLKKCAETVVRDFNGQFPDTVEALMSLPGIGDYTAAAIAAIAFQKPVAVVDGNIERVTTRQFRIERPVREARKDIKAIVETLLPKNRPGDFAQAMMDLGATLCSPKNPTCSLCPVNNFCEGYSEGVAETYPIKTSKTPKPTRKGAAFIIQRGDGAIFLRKRIATGLLGGMSEVPGTKWTSQIDGETGETAHPFSADWHLMGIARHTFTHFHLELEVWLVDGDNTPFDDGWWSQPHELTGEALPTVFKKAISIALPNTFRKQHDN